MSHHPIQINNQTISIYQQPQPGMTTSAGFGNIPRKVIMKKNRKRIMSNNNNFLDQKYAEIQQIINKSSSNYTNSVQTILDQASNGGGG